MVRSAMPSKRNPAIAGALSLILGPLGLLYIGWRYAVAGLIVFITFIWLFGILLFVPPWLKYVNVIAFAYMAVQVCKIWNSIIDVQPPETMALNTFPVAVFALTSFLPILAAIDSASVGLYMAASSFGGGEIGRAVLILVVATPVLVLVHIFGFSLLSAAIDRAVLVLAPGAPTNVFPTVRS